MNKTIYLDLELQPDLILYLYIRPVKFIIIVHIVFPSLLLNSPIPLEL